MIEKLPQERNDLGIARPKPAIRRTQTRSSATRSNCRARLTGRDRREGGLDGIGHGSARSARREVRCVPSADSETDA